MRKSLAANQMKTISILFLSLFFIGFVKGQTSELETTLNPTKNCFDVTTNVYSNKSGFCSTSIHLDSDSTFTFESGCEGRSRVTIGKYKIIRDSLFLSPFEKKDIQPFCKLEEISTRKNDSIITFIIKDKLGSPRNDLIMPKGKTMDFHDPIMLQILVDSWKDSLSINKFEIDTIEFPRLTLLTGKKFIFSTKELSSIVKITLNLNSAAILNYDITYANGLIPKAWAIKKKKISCDKFELEHRK
jgi:hypothetical protein